MRSPSRSLTIPALLMGVTLSCASGARPGAGGAAKTRTSAETLAAISMPDRVETAIGTLEFFDGVPRDATIDALYDNLDRMRGVEVYLNNQGAASLNAMCAGNASLGANRSSR
jgi:hypothetical protein